MCRPGSVIEECGATSRLICNMMVEKARWNSYIWPIHDFECSSYVGASRVLLALLLFSCLCGGGVLPKRCFWQCYSVTIEGQVPCSSSEHLLHM